MQSDKDSEKSSNDEFQLAEFINENTGLFIVMGVVPIGIPHPQDDL